MPLPGADAREHEARGKNVRVAESLQSFESHDAAKGLHGRMHRDRHVRTAKPSSGRLTSGVCIKQSRRGDLNETERFLFHDELLPGGVVPSFAEVLELASREREERFVTQASRNVRRTTKEHDRNLLAHRHAELAMQRPALTRTLHLCDPLFDVMMNCHDLFSFFRTNERFCASSDAA